MIKETVHVYLYLGSPSPPVTKRQTSQPSPKVSLCLLIVHMFTLSLSPPSSSSPPVAILIKVQGGKDHTNQMESVKVTIILLNSSDSIIIRYI